MSKMRRRIGIALILIATLIGFGVFFYQQFVDGFFRSRGILISLGMTCMCLGLALLYRRANTQQGFDVIVDSSRNK